MANSSIKKRFPFIALSLIVFIGAGITLFTLNRFQPYDIIARDKNNDTLTIHVTSPDKIVVQCGDTSYSFVGIGKMTSETEGEFDCVVSNIGKSLLYQMRKGFIVSYDTLPQEWQCIESYIYRGDDTTLIESPYTGDVTKLKPKIWNEHKLFTKLATPSDTFTVHSIISDATATYGRTVKRSFTVTETQVELFENSEKIESYKILNRE